jgi:FKBP-type peptidyl-prolyl cis-trans isomerase SlyD
MNNDDAAEDAAESAEADAGEAEEPSGLQEGDVIRLAYTARTVEDGHLVDTTDAEVAEEEGVGEDQEFAPRTIALGQGHIFETVEEAIVGSEVDEEGTVVVPAGEAFGEFDEEEVRTVSADKISEDDRYPGAQVQIGGEQGFVETIVGGRARVDFNHPLAGEDVEYEYEILEAVEDREERAQGLLSMFLDVDLDLWFQTDTVEEERRVEPDQDEEASEAAAADEEEPDEGEADAEDADEEDADDEDADEEDADDEDADDEPPEPEFETVEVEKESLYIEAIPQLQMNQQWMMQKQQIAQQLMDLVDVDRVVIQETIEGGGMGMGGMFGGMGGMGGGDLEAALEEADIDADDLDVDDVEEVAEEIEDAQ